MKRGQQQKNEWFPIKTSYKNGKGHIPKYDNIKYANRKRKPFRIFVKSIIVVDLNNLCFLNAIAISRT